MALTLTKGANLSLTKHDPDFIHIQVGLGWDPRTTVGEQFDLDASVILVTATGKVRGESDFVFYNQLGDVTLADGKHADPDRACVIHQGDNRDGSGDGDDEQIVVDLSKIPADVTRLIFVASIDQADTRNQNFGQVRNAYIRLVNIDSNVEVVRFDLSEDSSTETALLFAEIYRDNGEWKFKAVSQGYANGLAGVARDFGLPF